ncbi:MAG: hypothetical protein RL885_05675 [Planctomycetota bacterium]
MNRSARRMLLTVLLVVLHLSTPAFALALGCCAPPEEPERTSCCQESQPQPETPSCCTKTDGKTGALESRCQCGIEPALPASSSHRVTVEPAEAVQTVEVEIALIRVSPITFLTKDAHPAPAGPRHLLLRSLRL